MTFTTVSRLKRSETQTLGGCSVLAKKGATDGATEGATETYDTERLNYLKKLTISHRVINVDEVVGDALLLALSSRASLLRYVRPQGRGPSPSATH